MQSACDIHINHIWSDLFLAYLIVLTTQASTYIYLGTACMPVCMAEECEGTSVSNKICIHVHTDKPYLELSNFSVSHTVCII